MSFIKRIMTSLGFRQASEPEPRLKLIVEWELMRQDEKAPAGWLTRTNSGEWWRQAAARLEGEQIWRKPCVS